ncbi:MAG: hypothetical protein OQK09_00510 [Colwellia sp.]|nr:hypothetical protein [Colwellia sp.]MCW8866511.1 hypothetical protein [Colwellia sp.]MCW9079969.1 hypothetical protein [Colwellia sp.]
MKIVTTMTLFILAISSTAMANEQGLGVNSHSFESQLCLDAATGKKSLNDIAKQLNIDTSALDRTISCNDMGITKFAKKQTESLEKSSYVLTETNKELKALHSNQDATLCVIAATGNTAKLSSMARLVGTNTKHFVKYSRCNDLPVLDFVSQYGGEQALKQLKSVI